MVGIIAFVRFLRCDVLVRHIRAIACIGARFDGTMVTRCKRLSEPLILAVPRVDTCTLTSIYTTYYVCHVLACLVYMRMLRTIKIPLTATPPSLSLLPPSLSLEFISLYRYIGLLRTSDF